LTNWFRCCLCDRVFMALGMRSHLHHAHGIPWERISRMGADAEATFVSTSVLVGKDGEDSHANPKILAEWVRKE